MRPKKSYPNNAHSKKTQYEHVERAHESIGQKQKEMQLKEFTWNGECNFDSV